MFANALAAAAASELPAELVFGFADGEVNALLGVDGEREAVLALCALGRSSAPPPAPAVEPLHHRVRPISAREVGFPIIPRVHAAAELTDGAAAAAWRAHPLECPASEIAGPLTALRPLPPEQWPSMPIEELIFKRRSTRHYDLERPLAFEVFSTLLECSSRGFAADALRPDALPLHDAYLIVNRVEGLVPGVYLHHPTIGAVELLKEGDFRPNAARLAVEQQYAADAHVNIYYLTDLTQVLARYGNRGYRLAQLEASLYAGKLHLAAHALGHGAVGSTSSDDEVIEFFAPHAAGKSYMFVLTYGRRRRRATE
jgi:SagB-type dehydrogenase family enzyme